MIVPEADPSGPDRSGFRGAFSSRAVTAGLLVLSVLFVAGILLEGFLPIAAVLAGLMILFMISGSGTRILALVLGLHIILTLSQLQFYSVYIGFLRIRPDDLLVLWLGIVWVGAVIDGGTSGIRYGLSGRLIVVFLLLIGIASLRGLTGNVESSAVAIQAKTFGGYLFFFPAMWIVRNGKARRILWIVILSAGIIAALIFMMKGIAGMGEGVYYRATTGLRIATKQPNAIAAVMLVLIAMLWKARKKPALVIAIPALVAMIGAVIISQTRALWIGVILALAAAWILNLFRQEEGVSLRRKLIVTAGAALLVFLLSVFVISQLGIISGEDIAERTESESGNYLRDTSVLARLLSWSAVASEMTGASVLFGRGFGATITYYRPDYFSVRTLFYVDGSFFQTALNMGLLGCLVLGLIWAVAIGGSAKLFLRTRDSDRAATALGIFCALSAILIASVTASPITSYRYTAFWALLMALLQTELNIETDRADLPAHAAGKPQQNVVY
jgi:O-antigen ligase